MANTRNCTEKGRSSNSRNEIFAVLSACFGAMSLGTVLGYASPAIPDILDNQSPFRLSRVEEISWFVSIIAIGQMLGGVLSGPVVDRYGRQSVMIVNAVPMVIGWLVIAASPSVTCAYIGRFITGFSAGVIDVATPVYIAEVSRANIRGLFGSCYELFVNFGMFFVFSFGCILRYNWLAIVCAFLPTLMMILMCFMTESPRWLLAQGYREGAAQVLRHLRGDDGGIDEELNEIHENIKASSGKVALRDFLQPALYRSFFIVLTLMFVNDFSGIGVVLEYTVIIFTTAGTGLNPYVQTTIVGLVGVLANFITAMSVDRFGRRVMLIVSAAIMALSMAGMGTFFKIKEGDATLASSSLFWLPVLSLLLYNFGNNLGFGPIIFYLSSELFPLKARGLATGICITVGSIFFFAVSNYFISLRLIMADYAIYWTMSSVAASAIIFIAIFVPETKEKSLEQIETELRAIQ